MSDALLKPRQLDSHTIRRIAVESGRDPRTVLAALQDRATPLATAAVKAAVARLRIILDEDATSARAGG